jgi:hypothetical protein
LPVCDATAAERIRILPGVRYSPSRIAVVAVLGCALVAAPALGRKDAAPAGLPLPTGMTLLDSRNGNSGTSYVWKSTYKTSRPARDMQRYHTALKRLGVKNLTRGPGVNLSFHFKKWDVFACADPACAAPRGRFTVVVGIPGG